MATIVEVNNPFEPGKDTRQHQHPGGITVEQWLHETFPGFREFAKPTICLVDGTPRLRAEWKTLVIGRDSIVNFVVIPGDAVTALYVLYGALLVYSVVLALNLPKPGGAIAEPDPVYDLKGQRNQNRLGSPVEVAYGYCRLWPSYAARPYNKYIGNDQFQYQLFCLGQGSFDVDVIQIEDTDIDNFEEVEYELYAPGDDVTLFPDNVVTSVEVGGIELLGSNEAAYAGTSGPFTANASGTTTDHLEVDVTLPNGLYYGNDKGKLDTRTITALFEYREIDSGGSPVGSWTPLASFSKTLRTNTPQRFTLEADVTPGRYEVRGGRTNDKDEDARAGNTIRWDALRAFLPSTKDYGDVTLLAIKARATNNLNDRASNRVNVWATRKLRTRDGMGGWTAITATRSIVWAFADLLQNSTYGGRLVDAQLDLDALEALDTIYTGLGWNFDYVFEQRLTIWEAAKIIARCGRALPMLSGSQVTMIRDYAKTVPTIVFNQENIVQGSFSWDIRLAGPDEYDGLEIEYTDPDTFLPETILCLVDGEAGDYPEQVKFPGCTNRTQAYREGLYMRSTRLKIKENITFKTGLEGHLPTYGDLIRIVHDLPKWGQGGLVLSISGTTVTLNEPVVFGVGTHKIAFRKKDGTEYGPLTVTAGSAPNIVELGSSLPDLDDFYFDGINELPLFLFGAENLNGVLCTVVGLQPAENDTVEVRAAVFKAAVFDGDSATAPALSTDSVPSGPPDVPVMNCANVYYTEKPGDPRRGIVSWPATEGALNFRVQVSSNGVDWVEAGSTSTLFLEIDVEPGEALYVRVQPIGSAAGAWCTVPTGFPGDSAGTSPPGPVDDYEDFFVPILSPSLAFESRTKSGTANLCGFAEFAASSPPRYYLTCSGSGSATGTRDFSAPDCSTPDQTADVEYSGASNVTPAYGTCGSASAGLEGVLKINGSGTPFNCVNNPSVPSLLTLILQANCPNFTTTATQQTQTATGCCGVSGTESYDMTGSVSYTLSNEHTEEDAIALLEAGEAWSSWTTSAYAGATSSWANRTSGRTFAYQAAQARLTFSSLATSTIHRITVEVTRTNLDTMATEIAQVLDYFLSSDGSGEITFDIDIPSAAGYSHVISDIIIAAL